MSCKNRNNSPRCINCQGDHLATSYVCPVISRHKVILSLAATENIPIVEAKRKIHQCTSTSSTPSSQYSFDFRNFPLLENSRPRNRSNIPSVDQFYNNHYNQNRFSPLSFPNSTEDKDHSFAANPPSQSRPKSKKLSFSQTVSPSQRYNNNMLSNTDAPARAKNTTSPYLGDLLCYPNGRHINMFGNGVGYSNGHSGDASTLQDVSPHTGMHESNMNCLGFQSPSNITHALNELNTKINSICSIDFNSLNNSISSLAKSLQIPGRPLAKDYSTSSLN